ncbi:ABC transporter ATP-binding protein [Variovorax boronicumulans]
MTRIKVSLQDIQKTYVTSSGEQVRALDPLRLDIKEGEFVAIVGRSGCGKSTLLNLIAGFEQASSGNIIVDGRQINAPGPDRGVVFQEYGLFPWMSVRDNVGFGPASANKSLQEVQQIANRYIKMVGLSGFDSKYPHELSGGMRQRCALARTFANDPSVMLMDEPLAALDALTRFTLQDELLRIWSSASSESPKTVVYITHSIDEAIYLADKVLVMCPRPGRIMAQLEVPFERPRRSEMRSTPEFHRLVDEIWSYLRQEESTAAVAA